MGEASDFSWNGNYYIVQTLGGVFNAPNDVVRERSVGKH